MLSGRSCAAEIQSSSRTLLAIASLPLPYDRGQNRVNAKRGFPPKENPLSITCAPDRHTTQYHNTLMLKIL